MVVRVITMVVLYGSIVVVRVIIDPLRGYPDVVMMQNQVALFGECSVVSVPGEANDAESGDCLGSNPQGQEDHSRRKPHAHQL